MIQNLNGVKQSPLEIINEINADASKESFYESSNIANKLNKNTDSIEVKAVSLAGISEKSSYLNQQQAQNKILNFDAEINNNDRQNISIINENVFDNIAAVNNQNDRLLENNLNNINNNNNNNIIIKKIDNSASNMMNNYNSEIIESQNNPKLMNSNKLKINRLRTGLYEPVDQPYAISIRFI